MTHHKDEVFVGGTWICPQEVKEVHSGIPSGARVFFDSGAWVDVQATPSQVIEAMRNGDGNRPEAEPRA